MTFCSSRTFPGHGYDRSVMSSLGPLLNGLVNYEYWLPVSKMMYPGAEEFIRRYQARARTTENADTLGIALKKEWEAS